MKPKKIQSAEEITAQLTRAAEALLDDYTNDKELTAFTDLDCCDTFGD
jgi:hypothetical protein